MGRYKNKLKDVFKSQLSASVFQIELNSVKINYNEDVNSYSNRVKKLYFKLYNTNLLNKLEKEVINIRDTIRKKTLAAYIKGLIGSISAIVKYRNPETFE